MGVKRQSTTLELPQLMLCNYIATDGFFGLEVRRIRIYLLDLLEITVPS